MTASRPWKVLVVEDSPLQAEMLRRALGAAGYDVAVAGDGAAAIERARELRPDAIVSDVNMPVMDGWALCRAVRADAALARTPFVLVTDLSDVMDVLRGLEVGADAYLTKPYDAAALAARLESLLARDASAAPPVERVEVRLGGRTHTLHASAQRMLDLLVSTYDNAVLQNRELVAAQLALEELNASLEQKVAEKTVAVLRGASERRRAEERADKLAMAVEQSPEAVVVADVDGRIEYVNEAFVTGTGYAREEAVGHNPRFLKSGETPPAVFEAMWATLLAGRVWTGTFHNRTKAGDVYLCEARVAPLRDATGVVRHYVAVQTDVTDKRRTEAELARHRLHLEELVADRTREVEDARARADAANEAKSAFLANMSHEIRTPMNAIIGLTHLLRRGELRGDQADKLGKIASAADHLLALVNDVLDLSKIEAKSLVLERREFRLRDVVSGVVAMLSDRARQKGLRLQVRLDSLPYVLRGDPTRLAQALINLGANAVKFTEQGSVTLRVSVVERDEAAALLRFAVVDTGRGVPPDLLANLFGRFVQADASTTRTHGGTGLGLAITKSLAELMGGVAGAESVVGEGSTFWFTARVGLVDAIEVEAPRSGPRERPDASIAARHRGARVLLVEDNELNQEVARELLQGAGLVVDVAGDGAEAVEQVRARDYRVVLMDVQMPRMDGVEATRAIRRTLDARALPIVAMTASAFAEDWQRCSEAGMDDFVPKPIVPDELYGVLLRWLGG